MHPIASAPGTSQEIGSAESSQEGWDNSKLLTHLWGAKKTISWFHSSTISSKLFFGSPNFHEFPEHVDEFRQEFIWICYRYKYSVILLIQQQILGVTVQFHWDFPIHFWLVSNLTCSLDSLDQHQFGLYWVFVPFSFSVNTIYCFVGFLLILFLFIS